MTPYIGGEEVREALLPEADGSAMHPGQLNYQITMICVQYLEEQTSRAGQENYQTYNDIIGALECAKLEMYRRKVAIFEDVKRRENGDVYPTWVYPTS